MRLFTALDLPPEIVSQLGQLVATLRPHAAINWSPLDNLHITTKFIGEWPEKRLEELDQVLSNLNARTPFTISIGELGWFPNESSPKVLWSGIQGGDPLPQLASDTESSLAPLGIAPEGRPYAPHLTLARIKGAVPLQPLRAQVRELQSAHIGQFTAKSFFLYSSEPASHASIYRKLREYRFESALSAQQPT